MYEEKNRVNGCVAAEYTAIASSEEEVVRMANEQGVDLTGYTIEEVNANVKNELGWPYSPRFEREW